jgi:hypothetical protein
MPCLGPVFVIYTEQTSNWACWSRTKRMSSSSHWKLTCSPHDIVDLALSNAHSLIHSLVHSLVHSLKQIGISRTHSSDSEQTSCLLFLLDVACLAEKQHILEPTIYRTRGEHANHYATDAVSYFYFIFINFFNQFFLLSRPLTVVITF